MRQGIVAVAMQSRCTGRRQLTGHAAKTQCPRFADRQQEPPQPALDHYPSQQPPATYKSCCTLRTELQKHSCTDIVKPHRSCENTSRHSDWLQ